MLIKVIDFCPQSIRKSTWERTDKMKKLPTNLIAVMMLQIFVKNVHVPPLQIEPLPPTNEESLSYCPPPFLGFAAPGPVGIISPDAFNTP